MRNILKIAVLASLLSGWAKDRSPGVFSDLPSSPKSAQQEYRLPEPAPESVKEKALAAYAKSYWFQINPDMRLCMYIPGKPGYFAAFRKSGQPLKQQFPRQDTRLHEIIVDFDDQVRITEFHRVIY
jgi:hypothetical protein